MGASRACALFAALTLGACASGGPNAPAPNITIVNERSAVARCAALGQIQAQSMYGGLAATGIGYSNALDSLKIQTAQRGGTHLHLVIVSNTMGGTNMTGDAYRCPAS